MSPSCFLRAVPTRDCAVVEIRDRSRGARLPEGTSSEVEFLQVAVACPDSSGAPVSTKNRPLETEPRWIPQGPNQKSGRDTAMGCLRSQKEKQHSSSPTNSQSSRFRSLAMVNSLTTLMLSMTTLFASSPVLIGWIENLHPSPTSPPSPASRTMPVIGQTLILIHPFLFLPIQSKSSPMLSLPPSAPLPPLRPSSRARIGLDLLHHVRIRLICLGPIVMINLCADADVQIRVAREVSRVLNLSISLFTQMSATWTQHHKHRRKE